jgi:arginase
MSSSYVLGSGWFLLGAPWDCSGSDRGEAQAPDALRRAGLVDRVDVDLGDAATVIGSSRRDPTTGVRALPDTIAAAHGLAGALRVGMGSQPGRRPLVIGGDCSLLLGVFAQLRHAYGEVGLWSIDGHPDYLDAPGSETGETADLQLALLTGDGPPGLVGLGEAIPMVEPRHVALIGHRTADLDAASAAELARLPADLFTIDAPTLIDDPDGAGSRAASWAEGLRLPMWLHLDVDVLDPSVMPAVTYPQDGGPDFDQLAAVLAPLASWPNLVGVSIADFRPDLDEDGGHAARLVALLDRTL